MIPVAVVVVLAIWVLLAFIDDHGSDFAAARRMGTVAASVLAALVVLSPPAFAAGTTRYINEEAKENTEWLTHSIYDVLRVPKGDPPAVTPTTTVP